MKRTSRILVLIIAVMMLFTTVCFADGDTKSNAKASDIKEANIGKLVLEDSYPKNGGKNAAIENLGVKLYFNGNFTDEKVAKLNRKAFKLTNGDGENLPIRVLYSKDDNKNVVLVLLDTKKKDKEGRKYTAKGDTEYTFEISAELIDDNGNTLGKPQTITYRTLNQSRNSLVYMLMTVVMFGAIFVLSARANKKKAEKEMPQKETKVNPYKEAKKTGKSVEEIVEKDKKQKQKQAEKQAELEAKREAERLAEYEAELKRQKDLNRYKVKAPNPISKANGKYKPNNSDNN